MASADALIKDWVETALGRPKVTHEIEEKWRRVQITKPEQYRYEFSHHADFQLLGSTSNWKHVKKS